MQDDELLRYSRQIMLPQLDVAGQEKLLAARVLVVGVGGLGSPVAMYLAAAGVGHLVLVDDDVVDLSNLQRQLAHGTRDIGTNKALSARDTLLALNPGITVTTHTRRLEGDLLEQEVAASAAIVDCTDNFATRFALSDAAFRHGVPLVSGAAIRMEGQLSVFDPRDPASPCYRCLYDEAEELDLSCSSNGVLAPLVGIVGSIQAAECLKLLAGIGSTLVGRLLLVDALGMQFRELRLQAAPGCRMHDRSHTS
jgi:molybdopterin/thiamine biosynthesis adenylyltransferase